MGALVRRAQTHLSQKRDFFCKRGGHSCQAAAEERAGLAAGLFVATAAARACGDKVDRGDLQFVKLLCDASEEGAEERSLRRSLRSPASLCRDLSGSLERGSRSETTRDSLSPLSRDTHTHTDAPSFCTTPVRESALSARCVGKPSLPRRSVRETSLRTRTPSLVSSRPRPREAPLT